MTSRGLYYLIRALVTLVAIPFHEAGHALAAWLLGDPTAKREGRLSLNPFRHFDLMGTLCMVLAGVGWAKPVSTDPRNFKNPKAGMALTALAGPVANLLLARDGGLEAAVLLGPGHGRNRVCSPLPAISGHDGRQSGGVQPHPGAAAGRQPGVAGGAAPAHLLRHHEI